MGKIIELPRHFIPIPTEPQFDPSRPDFGPTQVTDPRQMIPGETYVLHRQITINGATSDIARVIKHHRTTEEGWFIEANPFEVDLRSHGQSGFSERIEVFSSSRVGLIPHTSGEWNSGAWVERPQDEGSETAAKIRQIFDEAISTIATQQEIAGRIATATYVSKYLLVRGINPTDEVMTELLDSLEG